MGITHHQGPVAIGEHRALATNSAGTQVGPNQGFALCQQMASFTQNSTTAVSVTLYIPAGSRICGFLVLNQVAWNSGSSATLTAGITAAGVEYLTAVDVKTAAGLVPLTATHVTATQSANWDSTGTSTKMVLTITPSGATSSGQTDVIVLYSPSATEAP